MRFFNAVVLIVPLLGSACAGSPTMPASPSGGATMTGTWVGATSESTGSLMGGGLTSAMMASTIWTVTQTGDMFSGTMQFPGRMGGCMTVTGFIKGRSGTFTMTFAAGSMMNGTCTATATGTFNMDDMMGSWSGS